MLLSGLALRPPPQAPNSPSGALLTHCLPAIQKVLCRFLKAHCFFFQAKKYRMTRRKPKGRKRAAFLLSTGDVGLVSRI